MLRVASLNIERKERKRLKQRKARARGNGDEHKADDKPTGQIIQLHTVDLAFEIDCAFDQNNR